LFMKNIRLFNWLVLFLLMTVGNVIGQNAVRNHSGGGLRIAPQTNNSVLPTARVGQQDDERLNVQQAYNQKVDRSLQFEENKGQLVDVNGVPVPQVKYSAAYNGAQLYFTPLGVSYVFSKVDNAYRNGQYLAPILTAAGYLNALAYEPSDSPFEFKVRKDIPRGNTYTKDNLPKDLHLHRVDVSFVGANPNAQIIAENPVDGVNHFYLGHAPNGIRDVKSFTKLTYRNIYPNIDVVYYGTDKGVKYDVVIRPGGNPSLIQMRYDAVDNIERNADGSLTIKHSLGEFNESAPLSYVPTSNESNPALNADAAQFIVDGKTVRFATPGYNPSLGLVIDPTVIWQSFYGGANVDICFSTAVDRTTGNSYFAGMTRAAGFPIAPGPFAGTAAANDDAWTVAFGPTGVRLWAVRYGGGITDVAEDITVDGAGDIIVLGWTQSGAAGFGGVEFPSTLGTVNAGDTDYFLMKLTAAGARTFSTHYGDFDWDGPQLSHGECAITTDCSNNIIIAISTVSFTLPGSASGFFTTNASLFTLSSDAAVAKFTDAGAVTWASFFGGDAGVGAYFDNWDMAQGVTCDENGDIYVTGVTECVDLPMFGTSFKGFLNLSGNPDAFIFKILADGSAMPWSSYYGGEGAENAFYAINGGGFTFRRPDIDYFNGKLYVSGLTDDDNSGFPIADPIASPGAFSTALGGVCDIYLAQFNPTSGARTWGTYIGGNQFDIPGSIRVARDGSTFVVGATNSTNYPTTVGAIAPVPPVGIEGFITRINTLGTGPLVYSTLIGGAGGDMMYGVDIRNIDAPPSIRVSVGGWVTSGTSFRPAAPPAPTFGFAGSFEAYMINLDFPRVEIPPVDLSADATVCPRVNTGTLTLTAASLRNLVPLTWESSPSNTFVPATDLVLPGATTATYTGLTVNTFYRAVFQDRCNLFYSDTVRITMAPEPIPILFDPPAPAVCIGQSRTITASVGAPAGTTFSWAPGDGLPAGAATAAATITPTLVGTNTYTVTARSPLGCTATATIALVVNPLPTVNIIPIPSATICFGQSVDLNASIAGVIGGGFAWAANPDLSSLVIPTPTASPVAAGTRTYTVTGTHPFTTCTNTASVTITVNPRPDVFPSALPSQTICRGDAVTLNATSSLGGVTFTWNPGTIVVNPGDPAPTVTPTSSITYDVTASSGAGCTNSANLAITVNPNPSVTADVVPNPICEGASTTITASALGTAGPFTYSWTGGLPPAATVTPTPLVTTSYTVTVRDVPTNCTATASALVTVNLRPIIAGFGSIADTVCAGQTGASYSVVNIPGTTFDWTVPPGASITGGQGTNTITVTWGSTMATATDYVITVTPTRNGCAGTPVNINVHIDNPPPPIPGPIAGPAIVCTGDITTYTVGTALNARTYTWGGLPPGAFFGAGQGTTTISINWATVAPGLYTITATPSNRCGNGPPQGFLVEVIGIPPTPGVIFLPTEHCIGTERTYLIAPVPRATSYTWNNSCGWTVGTQTDNVISFTATTDGPCLISVVANNACGSSLASTITVFSRRIPSAPSPISGPSPICQGLSAFYSVLSTPGLTYTWTGLPGGAFIASGQGTNRISVNWGTATPGTYTLTVTPTNVCGNGAIRTIDVTVLSVPALPSTITGPITRCINSLGNYSVINVPNVTYTWEVNPPGPLVSGSGNTAIINWNAAGSYVVSVTPSNICGVGLNQTLVVDVSPRPVPNAGADVTVCGSDHLLIGSPATGNWECEFCPAGSSIISAGPFGIVSGMRPGPHVFRYIIDNGICNPETSFVLVTNENAIAGIVNSDNTVCEGSDGTLTLSGFTPYATIVRWEQSNDNFRSNIVPIVNSVSTYTYRGITQTLQFRAVLQIGSVCNEVSSTHASITVVPRTLPNLRPAVQTVCSDTAIVQGNLPLSGSGTWTFVAGPPVADIVNLGSGFGKALDMRLLGDYTFRYTISSAPCPDVFADVVVKRIQDVTTAIAGAKNWNCSDDYRLLGNAFQTNETAVWSIVSAPVGAAPFVTTAGREGLVVNMTVPGDYIFRYTITNTDCGSSSTADIHITREEEPTIAVAGTNFEVCASSAVVMGNMPAIGRGRWVYVTGPDPMASINTVGSVGTIINMNLPGTYTFRWEITNGTCDTSFSEINVTRLTGPSTAFVTNMLVEVCDVNQVSLQAVAPTSGTGTWSFLQGPAPAAILTSGLTGTVDGMTVEGDYIFRWEVTNACGSNSINVTVRKYVQIFPPAFAGTNQNVCESNTALVQGSVVPPGAVGIWRFETGAQVANVTTFGRFGAITNMDIPGEYVFSWNVKNGVCPESSSNLTITRFATPDIASAGPNQEICATSTQLVGNLPANGVGSWSFVNGPVTPSISFLNNAATVSGMTAPGVYEFMYTIAHPTTVPPITPTCPESFDIVRVTVNPPAAAGNLTVLTGGGPHCNGVNSGSLQLTGFAGNIIRWEASTDDFNSFTAINTTSSILGYSNLTTSTSYRVITKQGNCPEQMSNIVQVVVNDASIVANAGPAQVVCGTSIILNGNDPGAGTGTWSFVGGPAGVLPTVTTNLTNGIIGNMTLSGVYVFMWTINNGTCGSTNSTVTVSVSQPPIGGILSPVPAAVCAGSNTGTITLSGNTGVVDRWEFSDDDFTTISVVAGPATSIAFNNLTRSTVYRAVIVNGSCPEVYSTESRVTVNSAVMANGGADQTICSSATTLLGNDPAPNTGAWTYQSGPTSPSVTNTGSNAFITDLNTPGCYIFRYTINNGACGNSTDDVQVCVSGTTLGGNLTAPTTVCTGTNTGTLTLGSFVGNILRWESSEDNWLSVSTILVTSNTLPFSGLTTTTQYRVVVQAPGCGTSISNPVTVTVLPNTVVANAGFDRIVCSGAIVNLAGNNPGSGTGTWSITAAVSGPSSPSLTQVGTTATVVGLNPGTNTIRYTIDNTVCGSTFDDVEVTVRDIPNGGVITGPTTPECAGSNFGTLNLVGNVGDVVFWQSSTDGFVTTTTIPMMTTSIDYTDITAPTAYRAVVTVPGCGTVNSTIFVVNVVPATPTANAGPDQTICGSIAVLAATVPTVGSGMWSVTSGTGTISNPTQPNTTVTGITGTVSLRWTIMNNPCPPSFDEVTVTVLPNSIAGILTPSVASVCGTTNSGTVNLAGNIGDVVRWEILEDPVGPVIPVAFTFTTYPFFNLTRTTTFVAVVKNGACPEVKTAPVTVVVNASTNAGVAIGGTTVCGGTNSGNITLTGHSGTILGWESSLDGILWTPIVNTSPAQPYLNLSVTTQFRAVVQSGTCPAQTSAAATVVVSGSTSGGTITGGATVCSGSNIGLLTLSGHSGSIEFWERSTAPDFNPAATTRITNTTPTENYLGLTQTSYYRAVVRNGTCPPAFSSTAIVVVNPGSVPGTIAGSATFCSGTNSGNLVLSGNTGSVLNWTSSTDGFVTQTTISNTTNTLTFLNLTTTRCFVARVQNGSCPPATTAPVCVTIISSPIAGTLSSDATVCSGANSGTFTLAGTVGSVLRWESSNDCAGFSGLTTIANTTSTLSYSGVTTTNCYRAVVGIAGCTSVTSNTVRLNVIPASNPGTITGAIVSCTGSASGTLNATGIVGTVVRWETSADTFRTVEAGFTTTSTSFAYSGLTSSKSYRVIVRNAGCPEAVSAAVTVEVSAPSIGGTVVGSTSVCGGTNSGTVTLTGQRGRVVRWESSTNCFTSGTPTAIVNTTTSLSFLNISSTTCYRAIVQNAGCEPLPSAPATITVSSGLVLNAASVVGCNSVGNITALAGGGSGVVTYTLSPTGLSNTSGDFLSIAPGTYVVRATDASSCVAETTVVVGTSPTPPSILRIDNITTNEALVRWTNVPPTGDVTYNVRYRIKGATNWIVVSGITTNSRFINGLQNNTEYEVEVQYVCRTSGAISPFSTGILREFRTLIMSTGSCITANPPFIPVPIPGGVFVNTISSRSARVNWNLVPGAAGYIVAFGPATLSPTSYTQVVVCNPTTSYTMTGLIPGIAYRVRVRTNCTNCTTALNDADKRSDFSILASFATLTIRGGDEIVSTAISDELVVYPNPNKGAFTVRMNVENTQNGTLKLFDAVGKTVFSQSYDLEAGSHELPVQLHAFTPGVYILTIQMGELQRSVKVFVN
jgi:hypothetical protein